MFCLQNTMFNCFLLFSINSFIWSIFNKVVLYNVCTLYSVLYSVLVHWRRRMPYHRKRIQKRRQRSSLQSMPCGASHFALGHFGKQDELHHDDLKKKMNSSYSLKQNSQRDKEWNKICPPKQQRRPLPQGWEFAHSLISLKSNERL